MNYKIPQQKDDEEVKLVVRRHPWFFAKPLRNVLFFVIIILCFFYFFGASIYTSVAIIICLIIIILILSNAWVRWSKTVYLVTNRRIITVNQENWFEKEVSEGTLYNILFISHKIRGLWRTILKMGTIHIRVSGVVEEEIVFEDVANPYEVQKKIVEIQREFTDTEATTQADEGEEDFFGEKNSKKKKSSENNSQKSENDSDKNSEKKEKKKMIIR